MKNLVWPTILSILITPVLLYAIEETPLSLTPEDNLISISGPGEFKAVLRNQHTAALHNLTIIGQSLLFRIAITPDTLAELKPDEERIITVKLSLLEGAAQRGPLSFIAQTDELDQLTILAFDVVEGVSANGRFLQIKESFRETPKLVVRSREVVMEIPLKAKSSPNLKIYIYGLIAALLLGFFIWRKVKANA